MPFTAIIARVATPIRTAKGRKLRGQRAAKSPRRTGRPSRADALLLRQRILDAATQLFLDHGYGSTSIEAVAARAGVSKRTFYDRFDDKQALFAAVVHGIIERIRPGADVPLLEGATLSAVLRHLARLMLQAALSPPAIALHRLVTGESMRFPELAYAVENDGIKSEAIMLIGGLLARELPAVNVSEKLRAFAAEQFIDMVIGVPQRRAMGFGTPMTSGELDAWAAQVVAFFLRGYHGLLA
jgi:AcrR family transcriptional regulator